MTDYWLVFTENAGDQVGTWDIVEVLANDSQQALEKAISSEQGYGEPDKRAIVVRADAATAYELAHPRQRVEVQCEIGLTGIATVA